MKFSRSCAAAAAPLLLAMPLSLLWAQEPSRADEHAPIAVMGDHYHEAGEFMFSYRYMTMSMGGNRNGSGQVTAPQIATTVPNRFFGNPMQPPTLRVVPTSMRMDMHMLGLMYAPSDRVTLMGMVNYIDQEMDHVTFQGPAGTQVLGTFTTATSGLGDTSLAALVRLHEDAGSRVHLTAGVSLPTADIDLTGRVLAPTGMMPTLRLPYPMQLGSGSYDALLGLTYTQLADQWSWGAQWRSVVRFDDNDEGYRLGDEHTATAWIGRPLTRRVSVSARVEFLDRGNIGGIDSLIAAPVQTADPSRHGATRTSAALGVNFRPDGGHRVALEWLAPLRQHLDGPQLETDRQIVVGYQLSF